MSKSKITDLRIGHLIHPTLAILLTCYVFLMMFLSQYGIVLMIAEHFHWKYNVTGVAGLDNAAGNFMASALPLFASGFCARGAWWAYWRSVDEG